MYQVVLAHTYLFWVKSHPSRTFPQRSLGGNSIRDPVFLPIAKPHPLNTLTRGPPPMYWLGTSRWCLGPLCTLYSVCDCFFLAFTSLLLLFRWLVFLCILACVYPLWHGGFLGSCFLPFILSRVGYYPDESCCLHSLLGPRLVVVGFLAINPAILLHCVCHGLILPLLLISPMGLLAGVPIILAH